MCDALLQRRRIPLGAEAVRHHLAALPGHVPHDLAELGRRLDTSPRTLKRRLRSEGTSFRTLLAQSRRARAEALLQDPRLSLTEIADQLGFADLSSFSQAFKRWSGVAPSAWRRGARGPAPASAISPAPSA
jgi:AraC-like DNA-binding protein